MTMYEGKEDRHKHSAAVSTSTCSGQQTCQAPCTCPFSWPSLQCLQENCHLLITSQLPTYPLDPTGSSSWIIIFPSLVIELKFQTENTTKSLASNLKLKIILSFEHSLFLLSFHKEMLTKTLLKRVSDLAEGCAVSAHDPLL